MASDDTFTAMVPTRIFVTLEFLNWEYFVSGIDFDRIEAAKEKIQSEGVVTSAKKLKKGLYEKKWKSGLRLYFAVVMENDGRSTLLILGSGKGNEQNRAIKGALKILENFSVYMGDIRKKD